MKNIILLVWAVLFTAITYAQNGVDIITKTNGEQAKGKVTEIGENAVKFVYEGETLTYTFNTSDIKQITFASGRTQLFNTEQHAANGNHKNTVAVMPFTYLIDKRDAGEAMTYQVQEEAVSFLRDHGSIYQLQDPTTTNALLLKAGVTPATVRSFTMTELCKILNVEFIITGNIRQDLTRTNTYQYNNSSYDNKSKSNETYSATTRSNSGSTYSNASGTTTQSYQTNITMNVFSDTGDNIFSESHNAFWATTNAYVTTLRFLLKKTPFYAK